MTTLAHPPAHTTRTGPEAVRPSPALAGVQALFRKQHADGHWCAELEGDSILNSEYLLMKVILRQHEAPAATPDDLRRFARMAEYLRRLQRPDGTWGQYPGSPPDLSACVKAYFALKLFGDNRDAPHMAGARERILELGGAGAINTFSMFYLACLGQVSWDRCPAIPPEIALLPRWFPFHLTKVAAWTRTMILPLAICTAKRPVTTLPSHLGIGELFHDQPSRWRNTPKWDSAGDTLGWTNIFLAIDATLKALQKARITPLRGAAITRAEQWLLERMTPHTTDGLGAIFPPMVYIQVALRSLGYDRAHPVIAEAEKQLDRFFVDRDDHIRIQPCFSPVWDTGIALYAATESGLNCDDERIAKACTWLLDREVAMVGDWVENLRPDDRAHFKAHGANGGGGGGGIGAWAFEYCNDWYPDVDDTAMVAKALWRAARGCDSPLAHRCRAAAARSIRWICAMQNDDGGWAAFDRTTHREWMEHVPFADHNAMQDPSCADITGRTIESLITCGLSPEHPAIQRALDYLRREQKADGSWWGRWGCNYLYGTWQATGGFAAAGFHAGNTAALARTLDWLRSVQNADGGFGESANSYLDPSLAGKGPSTASQTAWAAASLMFLLSGRPKHEIATDDTLRRAIAYLESTQLTRDTPADAATDHGAHFLDEPAGAWREHWFTGTGFPKVFYLRYHLYRHYFPVMALARWERVSSM
jgi:squalene-hopene/tetraprenyl-beta-curcumene cyclase